MRKQTIVDLFMETGMSGQISLAIFLIGIVCFAVIATKGLDLPYRLAFIPYSFLPFMTGIVGFIENVVRLSEGGHVNLIDPSHYLAVFAGLLAPMRFSTVETMILLLLGSILLLRATPSRNGNSPNCPS